MEETKTTKDCKCAANQEEIDEIKEDLETVKKEQQAMKKYFKQLLVALALIVTSTLSLTWGVGAVNKKVIELYNAVAVLQEDVSVLGNHAFTQPVMDDDGADYIEDVDDVEDGEILIEDVVDVEASTSL